MPVITDFKNYLFVYFFDFNQFNIQQHSRDESPQHAADLMNN